MNELRIEAFAQRLGKALDSSITRPTNTQGQFSAALARSRMAESITRLATDMAAGVYSAGLQNDPEWIKANLYTPFVKLWREIHTEGDAEAKRLAEQHGINPHRLIESAEYWSASDRANYARSVAVEIHENAKRSREQEAPASTSEPPAPAKVRPTEEATEAPKRRRGRPSGSRNKGAAKPVLPSYTVSTTPEVIAAARDLLWRSPGMIIVALSERILGAEGSGLHQKRVQAIIHREHAGTLAERQHGYTKLGEPKKCWYNTDERRGRWFHDGRLVGEGELSALAGISRPAMRKRLVGGMSVADALATERKNDGRRQGAE